LYTQEAQRLYIHTPFTNSQGYWVRRCTVTTWSMVFKDLIVGETK